VSEPAEKPPARARPGRPALFLERTSYRRRRLMDAARLLPVLGLFLFLLPLIWPESREPDAEAALVMSDALLYIFASWAGLIALAAAFGRLAQRFDRVDQTETESWRR
jgi:hypothetical protein